MYLIMADEVEEFQVVKPVILAIAVFVMDFCLIIHGEEELAVRTPSTLMFKEFSSSCVAYLLAADNGSGPLPFRLRCVNQPVISTPNVFSSTRSPLLGCIRAHFSCSTPRSSTSARF
jgi:hypothetical protein